MQSLKELYKIGRGPSSSHTIGPERACLKFEELTPNAVSFKAVLFGSLAKTGRGHCTDKVIEKTFTKPVKVIFDCDTPVEHPNTMDLYAYDADGNELKTCRVLSIGGGTIAMEGVPFDKPADIYPFNSFESIKYYCDETGFTLPQYVEIFEDNDIRDYLGKIWDAMEESIYEGLLKEGVLPGGLMFERRAKLLFDQTIEDEEPEDRENRLVCAYAYAVSEQNSDGGRVVTAPTCGSCGIVPAVLKYEQIKYGYTRDQIIDALETGGIIGNIVKTNASISGAECGCQAECGTACSMAAAAAAQLKGMNLDQIEYAAEVAMEHHLGLTCDPVDGLVQIPCIERNAVAAMRAIDSVSLAKFLSGSRQISFDAVVYTMKETGRDMNSNYRETAAGGLASVYSRSRLSKKPKAKKRE